VRRCRREDGSGRIDRRRTAPVTASLRITPLCTVWDRHAPPARALRGSMRRSAGAVGAPLGERRSSLTRAVANLQYLKLGAGGQDIGGKRLCT
jgi:hypothetical protein